MILSIASPKESLHLKKLSELSLGKQSQSTCNKSSKRSSMLLELRIKLVRSVSLLKTGHTQVVMALPTVRVCNDFR